MEPLTFVLAALAVYRIATDVALMDGPFMVFSRFRMRMDERFHASAPWLVHGVMCPICVAWWVALPAALLLAGGSWAWLLWWQALAGAAALMVRGMR